MVKSITDQINELKKEAAQLVSGAGWAVRNSKGFPEAVSLIEKNIDVMSQMNEQLEALKNGSHN